MKPINLSFDFDSTLSRIDVQEFISFGLYNLLVKCNIHIVTSRFRDVNRYSDKSINHDYLYKVANELSITLENIHFLDMDDKANFFFSNNDKYNFLFHLDDDIIELELINQKCKNIVPICVKENNWKEKCLDIICINL